MIADEDTRDVLKTCSKHSQNMLETYSKHLRNRLRRDGWGNNMSLVENCNKQQVFPEKTELGKAKTGKDVTEKICLV